MNEKHCHLKGSNKIYLVKKIDKNIAYLENNNMQIKTDLSNISIVENFKPTKAKSRTSINITSTNVENSIMLRHKLKEEALQALDKYIDQAVVANIGRIRIIHGRHGGVLREAVHEYLKTHPFVKEYYIADYSEGGIGVTIAILGKKK